VTAVILYSSLVIFVMPIKGDNSFPLMVPFYCRKSNASRTPTSSLW